MWRHSTISCAWPNVCSWPDSKRWLGTGPTLYSSERFWYGPSTYAVAYGKYAPFSMRNGATVKSFTKEFHKELVLLENTQVTSHVV